MDIFQQALAHAHATLLDLQAGLGKKPTATHHSLQRLMNAAKIVPQTKPYPLPPRDPVAWEALRRQILTCEKCPHLVRFRHNVVFGVGNPRAELLFVGEAPGADEDLQGEPFVGRAGELLTKMIAAMGLSRDDVFIANVLKCRPDMPAGQAGNRPPTRAEMETCLPWLAEQIRLIEPKVIVALGSTAASALLGKSTPMRDLRGKWLSYQGIPTLITYHPAYLLRNQSLDEKRKVWTDLLQVMERLGMPISEKQRNYFRSAS
jgi:DNA polymerase